MTTDSTGSQRPAKRLRTRIACGACSDRKARCDGARPTCQSCTRTKFGTAQCIYQYTDTLVDISADYVSSLEDRIRELDPLRSPRPASNTLPQAQAQIPHSRPKRKRNAIEGFHGSFHLPARPLADAYMTNYWDHVHPIVPVLHRKSFMIQYEEAWAMASTDRIGPSVDDNTLRSLRPFYACLNMALALGCTYAPSRLDRSSDTTADELFTKANDLLTKESMEFGSIQTVQALVLMALFLQRTDKFNACWVTIGMAIRIAQAVKVNVDNPFESQARREERRRIWWYCVLLDRTHSITFGRPPMVEWPSVVPFPALVDDDHLSMEPASSLRPMPTQEVSILAFFVEALKLSDILMEVLRLSHVSPPGSRNGQSIIQDFTASQIIDEKLNDWKQDLPTYLRFPVASGLTGTSSLTFTRQAVALKCTYLHLQVLLFRPVLVRLAQTRFLDARNDEKSTYIQRTVARGCVASCVSAAQELIDTLRTESEESGTLPPWWYDVFYLYTAETVILAVLVTPELSKADNHNPDFLEMTWQQGLDCFSQYELNTEGETFAARCRSLLQAARQQSFRKPSSASTATMDTEGDQSPIKMRKSPNAAHGVSCDASPAMVLLANAAPDMLFKENAMFGSVWEKGDGVPTA